MIEELKKKFIEEFGENEKEIRSFFSPSRINIIGEHIDYNGGRVLPCAIKIGTYGIARKNEKNLLRLKSLNMEKSGDLNLNDFSYKEENDWMNFAIGVGKFIKEAGYEIGGLDILIYGNIPNGSGLSSSSSLELLIGQIINNFYNDDKISPVDLALIGQKTENKFIGVNTGIMDQFVIACGRKNHAILLDTATLAHDYFPFDLGKYKIVIMNTKKRRELKDSKYNERRQECEDALKILQAFNPNLKNLCDIGKKDLDILENIDNPILKKRAKHCVEENIRVLEAVEALKGGNIKKLGRLLIGSNDSLRELYEVTGPHLDSITRHANAFSHCLGARMTGAGFGGCAIAIVDGDRVDEFKEFVEKNYFADTGIKPEFISSSVGDGARRI
ncbi:galactokinase [Peptoniphilaceae bacterium SGI.131]